MKAKELQRLREELLAERDRLLVESKRHGSVPSESIAAEDRDPADQANSAVARDLDSRIATHEDHLLEKIEAALERTTDGSYGICTQCGKEIPVERLRAKPSVSLCIACQTEKEKSLKSR